jgi:cation transport protein ChaC
MRPNRQHAHGNREAQTLGPMDTTPDEDVWIFAYGSLMWDPGFAYAESRRALLRGYHRSLCILSIRNRGTLERPGLALGLDRGGSCRGYAFRVAAPRWPEIGAELWRREMPTEVYQPRLLPVCLEGGNSVSALVFVARPRHPQYVCQLPDEQAAELVAQGAGTYGTALDYLRNTVRHLDEFGIADGPLHRVLTLAEVLWQRKGEEEGS